MKHFKLTKTKAIKYLICHSFQLGRYFGNAGNLEIRKTDLVHLFDESKVITQNTDGHFHVILNIQYIDNSFQKVPEYTSIQHSSLN